MASEPIGRLQSDKGTEPDSGRSEIPFGPDGERRIAADAPGRQSDRPGGAEIWLCDLGQGGIDLPAGGEPKRLYPGGRAGSLSGTFQRNPELCTSPGFSVGEAPV